MSDKNKKTSNQKNYVFRKGKLIEQRGEIPLPVTEALRALMAKKPFIKLTEQFMTAIGTSLQETQNTLPPEDTLKLPVGAMSYMLAHYYIYLTKVASVDDRKKFLKDFIDQTNLAVDIFIEMEKKDSRGG
jgi:hypothetical protein